MLWAETPGPGPDIPLPGDLEWWPQLSKPVACSHSLQVPRDPIQPSSKENRSLCGLVIPPGLWPPEGSRPVGRIVGVACFGSRISLTRACSPFFQAFSDDITKPIIDNIVSDLIQIYTLDTEIP